MGLDRRKTLTIFLALVVSAVFFGSSPATAKVSFGFGRLVPGGPGAKVVALGSPFTVARTQPDGTRDLEFGRGGVARARFPGFREGRAINAVQLADEAIVLAGGVVERCRATRERRCARRPALARFTSTGSLDPGFGHGGRVVGGFGAHLTSLASLPSGKVLAAGKTDTGRDEGNFPLLVRYTVDGRIDRSFGDRGRVVLDRIPGFGRVEFGRVDNFWVSAGRIVAAVHARVPNRGRRGLILLDRDGDVSARFGGDGYFDQPPAGARIDEYGVDLEPLSDGRLLVAGTTDDYPRQICLFRLNPDGSIDPSYGSGGIAYGPRTYDVRFNVELVLRPDGRTLVAAAGHLTSAIAGFMPDGTIDPSWGTEGLTVPIESWGFHASLVPLADGTVALGDSSRQLSHLIVARYDAEGDLVSGSYVPGP